MFAIGQNVINRFLQKCGDVSTIGLNYQNICETKFGKRIDRDKKKTKIRAKNILMLHMRSRGG